MNFRIKRTALLAGLAVLLSPVSAFALVSPFEDTFNETADNCVTSSDRNCGAMVLSNISQVRGSTEGEQYDFEIATFAASVADVWDDSLPVAACIRLSDALILISNSAEDSGLAGSIASVAEVVSECEGISILPDLLLASP